MFFIPVHPFPYPFESPIGPYLLNRPAQVEKQLDTGRLHPAFLFHYEKILQQSILFLYLCKFTYNIIRDVLPSLLEHYTEDAK